MPYVEPRPACSVCRVDNESRRFCAHIEGKCTTCCGCIRCGECGNGHIPLDWSLEKYGSLFGLTAEQIVNRLTFRRVVGITTTMTVGQMVAAAGAWRPPCKSCGSGGTHWLTVTMPPKLVVADYKEDNTENDNTSSKRNKVSPGEFIHYERRKPGFQGGTPNERVPLPFHMSVEIECAGGGSYELNEIVKSRGGCIVTDGSVSGGLEICTGPAIGDKFEEGIEAITSEIRAAHGYINDACGLHLHMDARELSEDTLYKMGFLFVLFEPQLIGMQPASRRNADAGYCRPIGPKWRVGQLGTANKSTQLGFMLTGKVVPFADALRSHSNDRYRTLNYCAYAKHKTLEVRLAAGTLMPHKIINWAVINGSLLHAAMTMTSEQVIAIEQDTRPVRERFLEIIKTEEARRYVIERQEKFKNLNTPEKFANLFDPMKDYRNYAGSFRM